MLRCDDLVLLYDDIVLGEDPFDTGHPPPRLCAASFCDGAVDYQVWSDKQPKKLVNRFGGSALVDQSISRDDRQHGTLLEFLLAVDGVYWQFRFADSYTIRNVTGKWRFGGDNSSGVEIG